LVIEQLEGELVRMQAEVAAAEVRASTLETSAATAKDQLLRLTADFDNFRRRTVSPSGGEWLHGDGFYLRTNGTSGCHDALDWLARLRVSNPNELHLIGNV